jgi:hypothetical protein
MNLYETTLSTSSTPSIRSSVYRAGIDRPPCDDLGISPGRFPTAGGPRRAPMLYQPQTPRGRLAPHAATVPWPRAVKEIPAAG